MHLTEQMWYLAYIWKLIIVKNGVINESFWLEHDCNRKGKIKESAVCTKKLWNWQENKLMTILIASCSGTMHV